MIHAEKMKKIRLVIVDVREPDEFAVGHASGSINIPLNRLRGRMEELRRLNKPLILCGDDDNGSAIAGALLRSNEISCIDAGSWKDVDLFLEASKP